MKRLTLYRLLNIILISIYIISVIVQVYTPLFNIPLINYWFPTFCIFFSISLLFKSIIFTSDSALWLSVTMMLIGLGFFASYIYNYPLSEYLVFLLIIFAIASISVGLIFKEIYQVKASIVLLLLFIPVYLFMFNVLNVWWCVLILIGSIFTSFIIVRLLPERWYANKK